MSKESQRYAKSALIIWVKLAELSHVIEEKRATIEVHAVLKRWIDTQPEGALHAKIRLPGDGEREAHLQVCLVHTPAA